MNLQDARCNNKDNTIFKSVRYASRVTCFLFFKCYLLWRSLQSAKPPNCWQTCLRRLQTISHTDWALRSVCMSQYDEYQRIRAENNKCCKCSFKVDTIQSDFVVSVLRNCQMRHNNENLKRRSCVKYPVHKFQSFSQI